MPDLDLPYHDRRGPGRPANDYRGIWRRQLLPKGPARTVILAIIGTVFSAAIIGAWRAVPNVVTEKRFLTDSLRRDQREAHRDSVTYRMADQVAALYCNSLLPEQRDACREQLIPRKAP